ncbi:2TM domain-containing protein [Synechococcus elongatus IITB4]|uniref:2TM domain-containing protein n=1 Tax=Synechococcus elongatus TaxID=32046 RepID=UPI0030CF938D
MADRYNLEDVQEILQRAIARSTTQDEFSAQQLQEMAAELGITTEQLQAAETDWRTLQLQRQDQTEFDQRRWQRWQDQAIRFLVINAGLMALNWITSQGLGWSLYVLVPWTIGLVLSFWQTWKPTPEVYEKEFQSWRRQRQLRQSLGRWIDRWLPPARSLNR